jgi:Leucine Rich repeats (2 copies)
LPNKDKLKGINLFGNQIKEIDFAELLTKFPNLKAINLDNNPLSLTNLDKLSAEKLTFLVENLEKKKIKISTKNP